MLVQDAGAAALAFGLAELRGTALARRQWRLGGVTRASIGVGSFSETYCSAVVLLSS